jgi:hypothetical protein
VIGDAAAVFILLLSQLLCWWDDCLVGHLVSPLLDRLDHLFDNGSLIHHLGGGQGVGSGSRSGVGHRGGSSGVGSSRGVAVGGGGSGVAVCRSRGIGQVGVGAAVVETVGVGQDGVGSAVHGGNSAGENNLQWLIFG